MDSHLFCNSRGVCQTVIFGEFSEVLCHNVSTGLGVIDVCRRYIFIFRSLFYEQYVLYRGAVLCVIHIVGNIKEP